MATVPEWVFKRITFPRTEKEIMEHAIIANNATCLNNNAWCYQCQEFLRRSMRSSLSEREPSFNMYQLETLCMLLSTMNTDLNEYRTKTQTQQLTYFYYIQPLKKLLTAPNNSDCWFSFTFKASIAVISKRSGVLSVLTGSKIESSEITALDSFCEGAAHISEEKCWMKRSISNTGNLI